MITQEKLYNYFSGNCTEQEILSIKKWVESSDENKKRMDQERVLFDILILHDTERATSAYQIKINTQKKRIRRTLIRISGVAAMLLLAVFITKHLIYENLQNKMQTVNVPSGQYISMDLPDGTKVWLNAQTSIKYNSLFNHKKRHVVLDGEAYFQVKRDESLPFEVETAKGVVRVLGTEFNVCAYNNSEKFETTLINGEVEVSLKNSSEKVKIKPNNQVSFRNGRLEIDRVRNYEAYKWKEGLLAYQNISFESMMKDFERIYGIKIIVENKKVQEFSYTGKFRIVDGVDYALSILQKSIPFDKSRDTENEVIYIK